MTGLSKWGGYLALLLAALGGGGCGWAVGSYTGRQDGRALERADHNSRTVQDLGNLISSHKGLIFDANAASKSMRQAVARRTASDARTTQELTNALSLSAASRAGCLFDAGSMQLLSAARARAAEAAAAGVRGALPGADAGTPKP